MKLEELKAMDIPELAPIEIEVQTDISEETDRCVGYFRSIVKQEVRDGSEVPVLTYYDSPNGPHLMPDSFSYEFVKDVRRVTILVPREESIS